MLAHCDEWGVLYVWDLQLNRYSIGWASSRRVDVATYRRDGSERLEWSTWSIDINPKVVSYAVRKRAAYAFRGE